MAGPAIGYTPWGYVPPQGIAPPPGFSGGYGYSPGMPIPGNLTNPLTFPGTGGQSGSGGGFQLPSWVAPLLFLGGNLLSSYNQNKNANANTAAQNAHNAATAQAAAGLAWGDGTSGGDDPLKVLLGQMAGGQGQPQQLRLDNLLGTDGLMQLMRSNPANSALESTLAAGGNPFDNSAQFRALGAVDDANTTRQVAGLRAGYSGLGSRFGSGAAVGESLLRQGISRDVNARNAGIAQSGYESAQGRALGAAQLLSSNASGGLDQLLRLAATNQGAQQQGFQNQLGVLSQIFQQELARRNYNANLLGITAGLNPAPITAPGYGGSISDAGQLLMLLPLLTGRNNG